MMSETAHERLDVPRDLTYIAKLTGWDTNTTRRKLRTLHMETGGTLLRKVAGRYQVSIAQLRRYWPDFGKKIASEGDLAIIERDLAEARHALKQHDFELAQLRRRVRVLEERNGGECKAKANGTPSP